MATGLMSVGRASVIYDGIPCKELGVVVVVGDSTYLSALKSRSYSEAFAGASKSLVHRESRRTLHRKGPRTCLFLCLRAMNLFCMQAM